MLIRHKMATIGKNHKSGSTFSNFWNLLSTLSPFFSRATFLQFSNTINEGLRPLPPSLPTHKNCSHQSNFLFYGRLKLCLSLRLLYTAHPNNKSGLNSEFQLAHKNDDLLRYNAAETERRIYSPFSHQFVFLVPHNLNKYYTIFYL